MSSLKHEINPVIRRYETRITNKKFDGAADAAVDVAEIYAREEMYKKAIEYYEKAKACAAKVPKKSDKVLQNEFLAHRNIVELLCEFCNDEEKIVDSLDAFLGYVKRLKDPSYKQIALHIASKAYQEQLKGVEDYLETAKNYALTSLKMLDQYAAKIDEILKKRYNDKHEFEADDSHRRRAGLYQLLASIADEAGDADAAEAYCNKALEFERLDKDPVFHHTVLSTQRKYVPRKRQYEISKMMLEILEKCDAKARDKEIVETRLFYAMDCLILGNLVEAGKNYWKVYNSNNGGADNREHRKTAKKCLIKLYKIRKRMEEVKKLEKNQPLDYRNLARMYEKIADEFCTMEAYEPAIQYYLKMKDAAALLPGDPEYGDLEMSRGAFTSLAVTFSIELKNHEEALKYYEKLLTIEIRLSCSADALADTRLNIAMAKKDCKCYSFEQQKEAYEKVKMPKDNVVLYVKYLEDYIYFLKRHKNKEGVVQLIENHSIELKKYQQIESDSQTSSETAIRQSSLDQYDRLTDDEIFEKIRDFYETEKDIEIKRKKLHQKVNNEGESLLHLAAKNSLKEVKLLIEKCGYGAVIDARDHGNWTPLSEAVNYGHADIVEYLISKGAKVDSISDAELLSEDKEICSGARQTPLMEACSSGFFDIICILIKYGANACLTNENNWTAGDYLEQFISTYQLNAKDRGKFEYILKHLREQEVKGGIQNRQKKALDLPDAPVKRPLPTLQRRQGPKAGVEMFQEALAHLGRRPPPFRKFILSKESKNDDNDRMAEDDGFIAPESDEEDGGAANYIDEDSDNDDAMDVDDYNFRQNNGFANGTTPTSSSKRTRKKQSSSIKRKSSKALVIVDDDEDDEENDENIAEDFDNDIMVVEAAAEETTTPKSSVNERKRKSETFLKRRSSNRSFESTSSKKTKRSPTFSKKSSDLSKSSGNNSVIEMVDSLSILQSNTPPPTRLNIDAEELDLSFSKNVIEVSTKLRLHLNLFKLCLKGSDFDGDRIDPLVDAICSCHKLVELDLSQVEQIQSIHANKILRSCLKLKVLDLYGTSVTVIDLQNKYILEKLIIAKTPFEYSDVFYQQINDLSSLSFLDVSHTCIDLIECLSKLSSSRTKPLQIKACPATSYLDLNQLSRTLTNMGHQNFTLKLPRNTKEELLQIEPSITQILE